MEESGLAALIDPQFQMKAFERLLAMNRILWLKGCRLVSASETILIIPIFRELTSPAWV